MYFPDLAIEDTKYLVYIIKNEIPEIKDLYNNDLDKENNEKIYKKLKFIKLEKYEEIIIDVAYRPLDIYSYVYFIINENKYYSKSKIASFDRFKKIEKEQIIDIINAHEEVLISQDYYLEEYSDDKYKYTEDDDIVSLYKHKDSKLEIPNIYEDLFRIFEIDKLEDIIQIEQRIDHEIREYYVYISSQYIELKNIKSRFDFSIKYPKRKEYIKDVVDKILNNK